MAGEKTKCLPVVLGLLLFLSLAGNVFLGGLTIAHRGTGPGRRAAFMSALSNLSPASRDKANATLHADMPAIRKKLALLREQRARLRTILGAPDYDRAQAATLMAQIRDNTAATQKLAQDMMLEIGGEITPAERAVIVKVLPGQID